MRYSLACYECQLGRLPSWCPSGRRGPAALQQFWKSNIEPSTSSVQLRKEIQYSKDRENLRQTVEAHSVNLIAQRVYRFPRVNDE